MDWKVKLVLAGLAVLLIWASIQIASYIMERDHYSWKLLWRDTRKFLRRFGPLPKTCGATAPSLQHPSIRQRPAS